MIRDEFPYYLALHAFNFLLRDPLCLLQGENRANL
jgi:hypothetical protein